VGGVLGLASEADPESEAFVALPGAELAAFSASQEGQSESEGLAQAARTAVNQALVLGTCVAQFPRYYPSFLSRFHSAT